MLFLLLLQSVFVTGNYFLQFKNMFLRAGMPNRVVRPTHQNVYHQKRHFFKIMLQRGLNNTHFQIVEQGQVIFYILVEIHPSLVILFLGGPTNHPNAQPPENSLFIQFIDY